MGCDPPQAAEESFPTAPMPYMKLHLHRAVIHARFPKAPRTQSLSLRLPRGSPEGATPVATEPKAAQSLGPGPFPSPAGTQPCSAEGHPPLGCTRRTRETTMYGAYGPRRALVCPGEGFFLASAFTGPGFCWWHLILSGGAGQSRPIAPESITCGWDRCPHPSPGAGSSPGCLPPLSTPSHPSLTTSSKSFQSVEVLNRGKCQNMC